MKNKLVQLPKNVVEPVYELYTLGDYREAIKQIKKINEKYPNQPLLFNLIGACYKEIGNLEGAVKVFKNAILLEPSYAEAYFNLGAALQALGQNDEAIESYQRAISIRPIIQMHIIISGIFY